MTFARLLLPALVLTSSLNAWSSESTPLFEKDVRPILKAHCWHCHGEEDQHEGKLDTRLARFILTGGESGPAVIPGDAAKSPLIQRISSGEMPPGKKKVSSQELEVLTRWVTAGAKTARPEPETLAEGDTFTNEERAHWSFQPVQRPPLPAVKAADRIRTPIDSFLLAKLESQQLGYGPEADRVTFIRRLTFDLTGLPPLPAAVDRFLQDERPDAYERLVDDVLSSPAYGERWGRHWLDVAGYADSDGYSQRDLERKWAYRYRDYVVRAFNADKPWNEFLVEQLAGDELLTPPYANLTPEQADYLIATGFLRMGPDGSGSGDVDVPVARQEVLAETIKIMSTSVLGLTVGCAQCHAHRYDPISHADYYRIRALIEPAYDTTRWRDPNARLISLWSDATRAEAKAVQTEYEQVTKDRTAALDVIVQETFDRELAKLPAETQPLAKAARETPAKDRTDEQKQLIKEYPFLNVDRGSVYLYLPDRLTKFNKEWDEKQAAVQKKKPADDYVQCLTEIPDKVPPTKLFARGDFNQPRQDIGPGELAVLNHAALSIPADNPALPTTGRRLAYARHLTSGQHPLTARVIVNRVWMHHFGRGLVSTVGDFGTLGEKPSHPELLDWLAADFMEHGWQVKRLHRQLVLSTAYRQASARRPELDAVDPENRLLGRMSVRRLDAESLRDSLLALTGQLSDKMFGPPVAVTPDEVGQIVVGVDTRDSAGRPTSKKVGLGEDVYR
ncbi:MAG TPA: PSD1 and planctomycete cytochrome C domain-containing protein, partial [Planctomycetaceae bacterium]|nr:PSD1 and planctomycete cytochrome C domain-containing protein [Planctomycetaceae bacterium]